MKRNFFFAFCFSVCVHVGEHEMKLDSNVIFKLEKRMGEKLKRPEAREICVCVLEMHAEKAST